METVRSTVVGRGVLQPTLIDCVASPGACASSVSTTKLRRNTCISADLRQQDTHCVNKAIKMPTLLPSTINGFMECLWRSRHLDEGTYDLYKDKHMLKFLAPLTVSVFNPPSTTKPENVNWVKWIITALSAIKSPFQRSPKNFKLHHSPLCQSHCTCISLHQVQPQRQEPTTYSRFPMPIGGHVSTLSIEVWTS